jgi:hypothetical protein
MRAAPPRRPRHGTALGLLASVVLTTSLVVTTGSATTTPPLNAALATSLTSAAGEWAIVPMGHLSDHLNTFWQLLNRPRSAPTWHDVTAFGIATNGGLVMASSGPSLLVGTLPSHLLHFSALASTASAGKTWTAAPPVAPLAANTSALSEGAGERLALVDSGHSTRVIAATSAQSPWRTLVTQTELANTPGGRSCELTRLSAVLALQDTPFIGGACRRAGVVGLFSRAATSWRLVTMRLPASLRAGTTNVLGTFGAPSATLVLLAVATHGTTRLAIARQTTSTRWIVTAGPALAGSSITSIGESAHGLFVLSASKHVIHLQVSGATDSWTSLPAPPAGTATVAFGPSTPVQALAVNRSILTVYDLSSTQKWLSAQTLNVPLEYGSSG